MRFGAGFSGRGDFSDAVIPGGCGSAPARVRLRLSPSLNPVLTSLPVAPATRQGHADWLDDQFIFNLGGFVFRLVLLSHGYLR